MSTPKTALIIGASRGLGLGLVKQLLLDGWDVTATVRDPSKADALKAVGPVQIEKLDMDDQQAVIALSQRLKDRTFDLLFVNAGVKGPAIQTPGHATQAEVGQLFFTNAVAPINLAQRFAPQIRQGSGVLAFMSSVLGSVTMPDAPDLALYKARSEPSGMVTLPSTELMKASTPVSLRICPTKRWARLIGATALVKNNWPTSASVACPGS